MEAKAQQDGAARRKRPRPQNDKLIIDSALHLIATQGLGGVSLNSVAKAAGLSHTALSHRYANRDEILCAVWTREVVPHFLTNLLATTSNLIDGDDLETATTAKRITSLIALTEKNVIAMEFLTAFASKRSLASLVKASFLELFTASSGQVSPRNVQHLFLLELMIGLLLVRRSLSINTTKLVSRILEMVRNVRSPATSETLPETDVSHLVSFNLNSGSENLDTLLESCLWSVAEFGFDDATTKDIVRRANVSEGYLFSLFGSKAEVFERATELQERAGFEANQRYAEDLATKYERYLEDAIFIRDWQRPEFHRQRAVMLEHRRVSWHNPVVKKNSRKALAALIESLSPTRDVKSPDGMTSIAIDLAIPLGAAVIAEMYPEVVNISHTPVTRSISDSLSP